MTTIDELRDIVFYILRKLNNVIVNFTREEPQPQPPPRLRFTRRITYEEIMNEIEDIERMMDEEPIPPPPPSPTLRDDTPKLIKDIYENLKEINDHHKPRCGTMEEFLENEIMKGKSFACFFNDKKGEYETREGEITELLELWKYGHISVDEIRKRLNEI